MPHTAGDVDRDRSGTRQLHAHQEDGAIELQPGEEVTHSVPAIGCTIMLTSSHLVVARDGSSFRPKTGVRRWELDERLKIRTGLVRHGTGSLVIVWERDATSVFVRADDWEAVLELVAAARTAIRRGDRPDE
jgi:hypothetical protein